MQGNDRITVVISAIKSGSISPTTLQSGVIREANRFYHSTSVAVLHNTHYNISVCELVFGRHQPQRLFPREGQVVVGFGVIDWNRLPMDFVTPASEVSDSLNRHANVSFQCQRVHSSTVYGFQGGQFLLVLLKQVGQPIISIMSQKYLTDFDSRQTHEMPHT